MLRDFDRFVVSTAKSRSSWCLEEVMLAWLGRLPDRKSSSVAGELTVVREFWKYLRRLDPRRFTSEPRWPRLKTESRFTATILSPEQVRLILRLIGRLDRPRFRRHLYRALFLVQYCAGLRFGEALRLRIRDVDLRRGTFFIADFKGRSRWVPFHPSLSTELKQYLRARKSFVGADPRPDDRLFVGANLDRLPVETAGDTFRKLYRISGMKPARGSGWSSPIRSSSHLRRSPTDALVPARGGSSQPPSVALCLSRTRQPLGNGKISRRHARVAFPGR